jgi:P27 family predicted phage terminase small subunit
MAIVKQAIPPPKRLDAGEQAQWKALMKILVERGTLSMGDMPAFAELVHSLGDIRRARAVLDAEGLTVMTQRNGEKPHPCVIVLDKAKSASLSWLAHFGLTPASRHRAQQVPASSGRSDPLDDFGV